MKLSRKKELKEKYGIKQVGKGLWGKGWWECLDFFDKNYDMTKKDQ